MTKEKIYEGLKEAKDYLIFIFIFLLFLLPFFKEFYPTSLIFQELDYKILIIGGVIGLFFSVICLLIIYYRANNKKQFFINMVPIFVLLLYMIWTFISCFFAENKELAFLGTYYRKEGYLTYLAYAGVFGVAFFIDSKEIKKILLYFFIIIAILTLVLVHIANYNNSSFLVYNKDIKTLSFAQFNHCGYYLMLATAFSSFLFISSKNKIEKLFTVIGYSFLLYSLIINDTFGCYLALISTFVLFLIITFLKKGKKIWIILSILVFAIISIFSNKDNTQENIASKNLQTFVNDIHNICTTDSSNKKWRDAGTGRMKLWKYGIKFFVEKPILGHGPENLEDNYLSVGVNIDRPHNLLIQLATTSGLPGLILYCLGIRNYLMEKL